MTEKIWSSSSYNAFASGLSYHKSCMTSEPAWLCPLKKDPDSLLCCLLRVEIVVRNGMWHLSWTTGSKFSVPTDQMFGNFWTQLYQKERWTFLKSTSPGNVVF